MLVNFDKLRDIFLTVLLTRNDYIEGVIPLRDSNGDVVYDYKISIDFQFAIPNVKELEELIPHDIDRHLYPSDWKFMSWLPIVATFILDK